MTVLIWIILFGLTLMLIERLVPDQTLPRVRGWWTRVFFINLIQLGIVVLGGLGWEQWLQRWSVFSLSFSPPVAGFVSYLIITLVFYWWHRFRHDSNLLWLLTHQLHHSPQRIETITSFYKHPLEILVNSILIASINFTLLGLSIKAVFWVTLYTALAEFFYHMNIATPRWVGYFLQRPEMHRIHHRRGFHYLNFADLPVWDMLFGTYLNPRKADRSCGFLPEREAKLWSMLRFKNVNNPYGGNRPRKLL
jgi:sterol desaturase/sphingolipid hydroxylase (fatty acid hydroxylase superfamily)